MKRIAKGFLCAILAIVLFTVPSFAHSGRTDEFGGHYDHSTGEYHYHHGYPAHQHENGVCPYDFDDQTNHGDSGTTGKSAARTDSTEKVVATKQAEKSKKIDSITKACIMTAQVVVLGSIVVVLVLRHRKRVKEELIARQQEEARRERERQLEAERKEKEREQARLAWEAQRSELLAWYRGDTATDIAVQCGLSSEYKFGDSGEIVPVDRDATPDIYTVYITSRGKVFHVKEGCSSARIKVNWGKDRKILQEKMTCLRCGSVVPPLDWLAEYEKVLRELAKYNISLDDLLPKEQEGEDDA